MLELQQQQMKMIQVMLMVSTSSFLQYLTPPPHLVCLLLFSQQQMHSMEVQAKPAAVKEDIPGQSHSQVDADRTHCILLLQA